MLENHAFYKKVLFFYAFKGEVLMYILIQREMDNRK